MTALRRRVYGILDIAASSLTINATGTTLEVKVRTAIRQIKRAAVNGKTLSDAYDEFIAKSGFGPELRRRIWNELSKTWK